MKRAAASKRSATTRDSTLTRAARDHAAKAGDAAGSIVQTGANKQNAKIKITRKVRAKGLLFRAPDGDVVQVNSGFSWDAFFVGATTTFFKRLWPVLAVALIGCAVASFFDGIVMPNTRAAGVAAVAAVFYFAYMVFCGINGNRWLVQSLRRRGYVVVGEA